MPMAFSVYCLFMYFSNIRYVLRLLISISLHICRCASCRSSSEGSGIPNPAKTSSAEKKVFRPFLRRELVKLLCLAERIIELLPFCVHCLFVKAEEGHLIS